ncbi:MAG: RsbRD N-terminal domain-containing protein [Desulfobacteraceae bacterium]|nr:RsbRD N-terminal domain-containing protein [Desulfobacteraceae bacterium]
MDFEQYLKKNKQKLVEKWIAAVIATYPADAVKFFNNTNDPFANPVGSTIKRSIGLLFAQVVKKKMEPTAVKEALDLIIRLRAVQEFTPSQAISFIFTIKHLFQKSLNKYRPDKGVDLFLEDVASNVDELILFAVDIYGKYREKIYLLRINQGKESLKKLLIKKEIICEIPDFDSGLQTL